MSETNDQAVRVLPASQIIDLFGGVRPLAKKLDMAASTVQGWKLRDHIPEQYHSRLRALLPADAQSLFDQLLSGAILASANAIPSELPVAEIAVTPPADTPHIPDNVKKAAPKPPARDPNAHYFAMPQAQMRYWILTSLAMIGILALIIVMLVALFFGKDIFDLVKTETIEVVSAFDKSTEAHPVIKRDELAPQPVADDNTTDTLRRSRDVIDSTLNDVRKIKAETPAQQKAVMAQIDEIETTMNNLRNRIDEMDQKLKEKGVDAEALQNQMKQISSRDVAAAALLLGVAQIHTLLDRQTSFQDDLKFLKMLMASDPGMVKSIDKLAPFAERGLMTKEQMNDTLNMIQQEAGTIATQNPDAGWLERIKMAIANVIQIRRDNDLPAAPATVAAPLPNGQGVQDITLPSTPREQVALAQQLLQDDSFMAAAKVLQEYRGPYADQVVELAHNLQGRDAATRLMDDLMQKSQNLLKNAQFSDPLTQPQASPDSLY